MDSIFQAAREAAASRERELLETIGIPSHVLDGSHHACPQCGGTDRFRFNKDNGSVFCNNCFKRSADKADIVASWAWHKGIKEVQAAKEILDHLGVSYKQKKKKKQPEEYLQFGEPGDGEDRNFLFWLSRNPLVTMRALKDCGARIAKYSQGQAWCMVITFPYYSEAGKITGYEMRPLNPGGNIPKWNATKKQREYVPKLACPGSDKSLLGPLDQFKQAKVRYRVEGLTDVLALNSVLPEGHVAIAIPGSMNPKPWQLKLAEGKPIVVIGDTDDAGTESGQKWAQGYAKFASTVVVPRLPYPQTKDHGKDVCDFLAERTVDQLLSLISNTREFEAEKNADGQVADAEIEEDADNRLSRCLEDLTIEVLWEDEKGDICVYCGTTRKNRVITKLSRLQHEDVIQMVGDRARHFISSDPESHQYTMTTVKHAIALQASGRSVDSQDFETKGRGIWRIGEQTVVCNGSFVSRWDGKTLEIHGSPRLDDAMFEFGARDWYDHDRLKEYCEQARDYKWCFGVMEEVSTFFNQWTWQHEMAHRILVGMVLATYIQTILDWRPQIAITGESDTGKSELLRVIFRNHAAPGMFGGLAWRSSKTSEAGIRQDVGCNAYAVAVDEWDRINPKRREQILELLRASGPADRIIVGSSHGKAQKYGLQHCVWITGVFSGIKDDADQNRFIRLHLWIPERAKWEAFVKADAEWCQLVGMKLMAIAVVHGATMAETAKNLANESFPGIHDRIIRNLAVPAACLAVPIGGDPKSALTKIIELIASVDSDELEVESAHRALLDEILSAKIDLGHGDRRQLSALLESLSEFSLWHPYIEASGIAVRDNCLFVGNIEGILKETSNQKVREILVRIPGATRKFRKISGKSSRGVMIPCDWIEKEFSLKIVSVSY